MESKEALENITDWIEYFTRLDYVEPIVRGEVQQKFYDAYHKTRPELELIKKDLERLEQIDNANPSKALKILETFENDGLLNKEIGAIMYNQIWLKNQIEVLKQSLLKAQEQEKVLETVKADLIIELNNKKNAIEMFKQERISREKQDKILRIIKDKNVDIKQLKHFIQCYTKEVSLKTYNDYHSKEELTQEEYDLFEEWLDGKD